MRKIEYKLIDLDEDETENLEYEYMQIINSTYPNLPNLNKEQFKILTEKALNGDREARDILEQFALKCAFQCVVQNYLRYDMAGYRFEDSLSDVYIELKQTTMDPFFKASNLQAFKFFIKKITFRNLKRDYIKRIRKNSDVAYYLETGKPFIKGDQAELESKHSNEGRTEAVRKVIDSLGSDRLIKYIELYFGFDDGVPKSRRKIGEIEGISGQTVGPYVNKALRMLRHPSRSKYLKSYIELE